jgi:Mechanosensitive ion channel/Conserved TM helix
MDPKELAQQTSMLWKLALEYMPPIVGAFIVLFIGWTIANWVRRFVTQALERTKIDATLKPVIASVARYIVLGLTLMVVMQQFGVQTASLLALLGTIGLAIGLALQGTLSNVAAGLMLLFLRPFEVGNHVEAGGAEGVVLGIDLFHTNLRTTDHRQRDQPAGGYRHRQGAERHPRCDRQTSEDSAGSREHGVDQSAAGRRSGDPYRRLGQERGLSGRQDGAAAGDQGAVREGQAGDGVRRS